MANSDTRSLLLAHIVEHGEATVAELAAALDLSDATVRRHLDRLMADDLLSSAPVRQATGRPFHRYRATEDGVRRERDRSAELAARLMQALHRGQPSLDSLVEGVAQDVAGVHRDKVSVVGPLERRVERTVAALRAEGILDHWERTEHGYRLQNHGCPYRSAADASATVCECDRRAIEILVGTAVQQVASLVNGDATCEYLIPTDQIQSGPIGAGRDRVNPEAPTGA